MEPKKNKYPKEVESELLFVQLTISEEKHEQAIQMLSSIKQKHRTTHGLSAAERAYESLLEWLLEDGEKPKVR